MTRVSLAKDSIRFLLLEGVHPDAEKNLRAHGYTKIRTEASALSPAEMQQALKGVHFVGIRSRTQLSAELITKADKLVAVGCFCIGTNQVDIKSAELAGIPVFNAPFSNTRSVAELVLAEAISLLRGLPEKNAKAHRGIWQKTAKGAYEARGKTLGIIGYGHIGSQLSILAEHLGMQVVFYDIEDKLVLGNARQLGSLNAVLAEADVLSLHVPQTDSTAYMIGEKELAQLPQGAILINASRGNVVDIDALKQALVKGHLAGAAIDVFPSEPGSNDEAFHSPLQGLDNVILTPHVGGSTQEAQRNIAIEVANKLVKYSDNGSTLSAVNFPQVSLPVHQGCSRLLHIHQNVPGVLTQINQAFAQHNINVAAQYLQTTADIGYVVIDVDTTDAATALSQLKGVKGTIRARVLHPEP